MLFFRFAYAKDEGNNPAAKRHAVVISVDGLPPDLYLHPDKYGLKIPNIRRLRAEGSYAEAVEGVYPSATYPSQTTLVTGRWPREHGVYTNCLSREAGKRTSDRYWFAEAIRVPTLWDWVREAGLTTAAVSWPVSTGAEIDWNVPEIRDTSPRRLPIWQITAEHSRPRGLLEEAFRAVGEPRRGEHTDDVRARVANYIFKTDRPNLLLLHLIALDLSQHRFGPGSKEAREAMEKVDGMVGELISTVEQAGLAGQTAFFVVSDHGMLPVRHYLYPNTLLARAGLLNVGERGRITGGRIATTSNGGSFFISWPSEADGALRERVDRALAPMRQAGAFWGLFGAEAMADLKADGGACLALDAARGYAFMPRATGHWRGESPRLTGTHGNHPMRPGLEASFLAAGPGLRHAIHLGRVQMLSVAPTLARMIDVNLKGVLHCVRAVAKTMIANRYGRILNLASIAALGTAFPGTTPYAATKAAVVILTKRMAFELGAHNINVNAISPGFIKTDMTIQDENSPETQKKIAGVAQRSMLGRVGEPKDIAGAALFLVSGEASFITAQTLTVDGGRMDYLSYSV